MNPDSYRDQTPMLVRVFNRKVREDFSQGTLDFLLETAQGRKVFPQYCHFDEGEIFASSSVPISQSL